MTHTLLMLRPKNFGFNFETKSTNSFQNNVNESNNIIQEKAIIEFNEMVNTLNLNDIKVEVFDDNAKKLPDAIFMNNWISIFPDGKLIVYPIYASNRREEKRTDIINHIIEKYDITEFIDLSYFEENDQFLEGTGSVVFDYNNKIAYAAISNRTNETVFNKLCEKIGYKGFVFSSSNINGESIYHTNVILTITDNFAIICLECINDPLERNIIQNSLIESGKTIIAISYSQLNSYAGNTFEVFSSSHESKLIMSRTAYSVLTENQIKKIENHSKIIEVNISIIERVGGGSARCMLTGVNC